VQAVVQCAGAIVHDHAGRLLLVRRANEPSRGLWCEPSGRCEPGEDAADAAVRETFEETGLVVRAVGAVGSVDVGHYRIDGFRCSLLGGILRAGDDAADARWVDAAQFATLPLAPGLADTLRDWNCLPR
jgi:ADP-ribose pyrophosphatase YjhB (NUDIX family)